MLSVSTMISVVGRLLLLLAIGFGPTAAQGTELTFDFKIERRQVPRNMRVIRVGQGDVVKLRWTTDSPINLHLHGYDIEVKVEPGSIAEMAFIARVTGRFSIEESRPVARGGHSHGEAALVRIEVRPR